ncbi:MAG: 3-oxoacyl-[acyl-carrier-protein] reductase [Chloroflexi bacterium]|nr:3-oxoacyl-[acyl-carrier-protein] reductase [Chloroflexota bacterium]
MKLENKVALVTGSGQGIGRAIALKMADHGANVVVNARNIDMAKAVVAEIESRNRNAVASPADVTIADNVKAMVDLAASSFGRIDILVNNAGIARDALLLRMSDDEWDQVLATDLKGAFLCTRAALRHMIKQRWGRIINISSVIGLLGNPGQANYAAAKAGLIALTKSTAREVASRGITANAIAPGFIDTGMTRKLGDKVKQEYLKQIPVGCFGSPDDVANAAVFLASEESRYITGQVVNVDGGMVMG